MDLRSAHKPLTQPPARLRLSLTRTLDPESPTSTDQHYQLAGGGLYDGLAQHKNKQRLAQYVCVPSHPQTPTPSQGLSEEDWEEEEEEDEDEEDGDNEDDDENGPEEAEGEMAMQGDALSSKCVSWSGRAHIIITLTLITIASGYGSAVCQPSSTVGGSTGHTTSKAPESSINS